jgi:hypothetical protein
VAGGTNKSLFNVLVSMLVACKRYTTLVPSRHVMPDHTLRIARLKVLFVAARIQYHGHRDVMKYSIHDNRTKRLVDFLKHLDRKQLKKCRTA